MESQSIYMGLQAGGCGTELFDGALIQQVVPPLSMGHKEQYHDIVRAIDCATLI